MNLGRTHNHSLTHRHPNFKQKSTQPSRQALRAAEDFQHQLIQNRQLTKPRGIRVVIKSQTSPNNSS